jgi:hypothetical protein
MNNVIMNNSIITKKHNLWLLKLDPFKILKGQFIQHKFQIKLK